MRLGYPHPDYLLPYLTAGQLQDWEKFDRRYGLGVNRDDIHWGMSMAFFVNANLPDGEAPIRPTDVMPYHDAFGEDVGPDELRARILGALGR